eukprot:SM000004S15004  [mRNA]  locus=s4:761249:763216:+ [translate_table: standard]
MEKGVMGTGQPLQQDSMLSPGQRPIERSLSMRPRRGPRHRPRNAWRQLRAALWALLLVATSSIGLLAIAPAAYMVLRPLSIFWYRRLSCFFFGRWLSMWPFLFEKVNRTKVVFAGEDVVPGERVILICNHRTEVDWMYLWSLAKRKGRIGHIKYVLKSTVRMVPVFGWAFHTLEFLMLDRKWERDEATIRDHLATFVYPQDPLWLVIFPEGTDFRRVQLEEKRDKANSYAAKLGLPALNNVLVPRTKGFFACLTPLRNSIDAVYDLTIGYNYVDPDMLDNLMGVDPAEVHIHVRRVPMADIPVEEAAVSDWVYKRFQDKDKLLAGFYKSGHFPESGIGKDLGSLDCLASLVVSAIVSVIGFWQLAYGPAWFRAYMLFAAVFLTTMTYLQWRPGQLYPRKVKLA